MKLSYDKLESLLDSPKLDNRKKNFIAKCPYCGQSEWGISIYTENHPFNCYRKKACGRTGNIFTLLTELGRLDEFISSVQHVSHNLISKIGEQIQEPINLTINTITPPIGWKRVFDNEYLNNRKFSAREYQDYPVGVSKIDSRVGRNYITFLVKQFGEIKGYVGRHIWDKKRIDNYNKKAKLEGKLQIQRYSNSPETDFSKLLYGYDEITLKTKLVILVEGIFDKIAIDRMLHLYQQDEIKCVATFKCHLSPEQSYLLQLKGIRSIVLLYDGDVIREIKKTGYDCENLFENVKIAYLQDKDPDEMCLEELDETLSRLETPSEFSIGKVQKKKLL